MKIALYVFSGASHETVGEAFDWREEPDSGYVRVSEFVEVEFQRLPPEVVVPAQIAQLDAAEAELRNKFNEKLAGLNVQRANLLALTHQVQP